MASVSPDLRVVLLGNTGGGKSALANVILKGETLRETETTECEIHRGKVDGRNISVIDTPGINSATLSSEQLKTEARKCLSLSDPGPHAFLLVIRIRNFTEDQRNTVEWIQENFGEEALRYTMVLFTGKENLTSSQLSTFIEETNVHNFAKRFGGGHAVINSKREMNLTQITKLLKKIDEMVHQNRGQHYTKAKESDRQQEEPSRSETERQKQDPDSEIQEDMGKETQVKCRYQQEVKKRQGQEDDRQEKTMNETKTMLATMFRPVDASKSEIRDFQKSNRGRLQNSKSIEMKTLGKMMKNDEQEDRKHVRKPTFRFPDKTNQEIVKAREELWRQEESRREREQMKWTAEIKKAQNSGSDVRIVLLGRRGTGKSSTGNTILGREAFGKDLIDVPSTERVCKIQDGTVGIKSVTVIDTNGNMQTSLFAPSTPMVMAPSTIQQCLELCSPGPHVFLLVMRSPNFCWAYETFYPLKDLFGEEFIKRSIVLITHGDIWKSVKRKDFSVSLEKLVNSCGGRYHIFNNEQPEDCSQVTKLIEKIETLIEENDAEPFTNEMYQEAQNSQTVQRKRCSVS